MAGNSLNNKYFVFKFKYQARSLRPLLTFNCADHFDLSETRKRSGQGLYFRPYNKHWPVLSKDQFGFQYTGRLLGQFDPVIDSHSGHPDNSAPAEQQRAVMTAPPVNFVIDEELFQLLRSGNPQGRKAIARPDIANGEGELEAISIQISNIGRQIDCTSYLLHGLGVCV